MLYQELARHKQNPMQLYSVRFLPVGPEDSVVGSPTQMAVFTR